MLCCHVNKYEISRFWVLVSIMDFMPGKGEHETCIFATFTGKAARRRGVTFMST